MQQYIPPLEKEIGPATVMTRQNNLSTPTSSHYLLMWLTLISKPDLAHHCVRKFQNMRYSTATNWPFSESPSVSVHSAFLLRCLRCSRSRRRIYLLTSYIIFLLILATLLASLSCLSIASISHAAYVFVRGTLPLSHEANRHTTPS